MKKVEAKLLYSGDSKYCILSVWKQHFPMKYFTCLKHIEYSCETNTSMCSTLQNLRQKIVLLKKTDSGHTKVTNATD